jgi:arsenate reductase
MIKLPMVLILCTGNSCRSQMAEGFLKRYHGEKYDVQSAGTDPKPEIHPLAVRVMNEIGIDISMQRPKPLAEFLGHAPVRHLLIVCNKADGTCPRIWPGTYTREYLPFGDPAEFVGAEVETLEEFRKIRDEIGSAMKTWAPDIRKAGR